MYQNSYPIKDIKCECLFGKEKKIIESQGLQIFYNFDRFFKHIINLIIKNMILSYNFPCKEKSFSGGRNSTWSL